MSRAVILVVALVAVASVTHAAAQSPAPAPMKAAAAKKTEGAEAVADKKISTKNLPAAVKATVEAESKGATIKGISSEKENGKTVYELETLVNGRTRDLMIDAAGKVYVVEEQLDIDKAPAAVKAALEAKGKIVALESVLENGKTRYEGQVQTKTRKKVAFEVDTDGKPYKK